jgi:hypothetical protein
MTHPEHMSVAEWIALLLTLAFITMMLTHSSGVVNVEKFLTNAGNYLIKAVTLQSSAAPAGTVTIGPIQVN